MRMGTYMQLALVSGMKWHGQIIRLHSSWVLCGKNLTDEVHAVLDHAVQYALLHLTRTKPER